VNGFKLGGIKMPLFWRDMQSVQNRWQFIMIVFAGQLVNRYFLVSLQVQSAHAREDQHHVLLIGDGPLVQHLYDNINGNPWAQEKAIGRIQVGNSEAGISVPVLGKRRIGHFIRKTSIDELPQLFNVLSGQMSMVGPRPHAIAHNTDFDQRIDAYMTRHRIKPGITGLAQINGYRGEINVLEKMKKRVEYDMQYINNWSFWLDMEILLKTIPALLRDEAY